MRPSPAFLIRRKRDGAELSRDEIGCLVTGIVDGSIDDAQLGALLMAGFVRGSTDAEIASWTRAMRDSGFVHDLSALPGAKVDKHSTGGVGDKVSLVLAPLVASCGVLVPMISGRGLGHTGGTVDKLESIPGFSLDLSPADFLRGLEQNGVAMAAATADIAPADRRMYATRDVTATVDSVPWIVSSILSKKLAEGIDALVLDIKCGRGAFMTDSEAARTLASKLVETARLCGCETRARITDMDQPLGRAVGNAIEVRESVDCLRGAGPSDLRECVAVLAADMLVLGGVSQDFEAGRARALAALDAGSALERFRAMVGAQGGDERVADDPEAVLPRAACKVVVEATAGGFVADLDPMAVALAALELGAGRRHAHETIDHAAGVVCEKKPGEAVERGEAVFTVHARSAAGAASVRETLAAAVRIDAEPPDPRPLILETLC